jgi:hypothetical protein
MKVCRWICLSLLFVCLFFAKDVLASPPPTQPGTYHDWNGDLDEVTVLQRFLLKDYRRIDITPLVANDVPLPSPQDNTYKAVKEVIASSMRPFLVEFTHALHDKSIVVREGSSSGGPGLLIIRGRIMRIDPGSQAARYFGGFGAGAAAVQIKGEIIDGRSKKVLAQFRQERRSGFGLIGGGYHALLERDLKEIGGDTAKFLNAF